MTETRDYSLVETNPGVIVAHRPDCPLVHTARLLELPIATLLGCAHPLPADIRRGECLEEEDVDG